LLLRAIRYAIGPERVHEELRNLALRDELTGVLNLRGFAVLAEQQLKLARRTRRELLLAYFDLDKLKQINDTYGHHEGNQALAEAADVLRKTLRSSDIIGRLGGDEFASVIMEAGGESRQRLLDRLGENLHGLNAAANRNYTLSLSVGIASYDPRYPCSLHELLARADRQMYAAKRDASGNLAQ
jgi:two-component system, cell cycle response regulator